MYYSDVGQTGCGADSSGLQARAVRVGSQTLGTGAALHFLLLHSILVLTSPVYPAFVLES